MRILKLTLAAGLALALAGCSQTRGSIVPLAFASSSTNTYVNALNGGIVSRVNDVQLDSGSRKLALEAEYKALEATPSGQAVVWQGDGIDGKVVAAAPYQVGSQNCRQYTHTLIAGSQSEIARGVACRNGDGTWTPLT